MSNRKYFYVAIATESDEGWYAHAWKFTESDNVASFVRKHDDIYAMELCNTRKRAITLVDLWNKSFIDKGNYAFQDAPFR